MSTRTQVTNEAAERLPLSAARRSERIVDELQIEIDAGHLTPARAAWFLHEHYAALAAERRATVERIRERIKGEVDWMSPRTLYRILDAEAAR